MGCFVASSALLFTIAVMMLHSSSRCRQVLALGRRGLVGRQHRFASSSSFSSSSSVYSSPLLAAATGAGGVGGDSASTAGGAALPPRPLLVSIEGNIGAGKSTLLDALRLAQPDWIFIDEPVAVWSSLKNDKNESILEVFYKDRKRWSYTFQNCALLTRYQNIEESVGAVEEAFLAKQRQQQRVNGSSSSSSSSSGSSVNQHQQQQQLTTEAPSTSTSSSTSPSSPSPSTTPTPARTVFFTERCLDTDFHVFTQMLKAENSIDCLEYALYEKWFLQLKKTATPLAAIVHVDTLPEECATRIAKRGREGEEAISLSYLHNLDFYQRKWVDGGSVPLFRTKVNEALIKQQSAAVIAFVNSLV